MIFPCRRSQHSNQYFSISLRIAPADRVEQAADSQFGCPRIDARQIVFDAAVAVAEFKRQLVVFRNVRSKKAVSTFDSGAMQVTYEQLFRRICSRWLSSCRSRFLTGRSDASGRERNEGQAISNQPGKLPNGDGGDEKKMERQPRQTNIFPAHV